MKAKSTLSPQIPTTPGKTAIRKELEAVAAAGRKPWTVFEDWLDIVHASLKMMPQHALALSTSGTMAEDPLDVLLVWQRINAHYKPAHWQHFKAAFHLLLEEIDLRTQTWGEFGEQSWDVIGDIYQEIDAANKHTGQFFTPWALSFEMAKMVLREVEPELEGRHALHPYIMHEPACGSGALILATACCLPRDMVQTGAVRFYGQDIDATCVKMAQINTMLYGLNGWGRMWRDGGYVLSAKFGEILRGHDGVQLPEADCVLPPGRQLSLL